MTEGRTPICCHLTSTTLLVQVVDIDVGVRRRLTAEEVNIRFALLLITFNFFKARYYLKKQREYAMEGMKSTEKQLFPHREKYSGPIDALRQRTKAREAAVEAEAKNSDGMLVRVACSSSQWQSQRDMNCHLFRLEKRGASSCTRSSCTSRRATSASLRDSKRWSPRLQLR